ncbi:EamA family transporter [Desulfovibrio sp. OttesenSCG-928-F20]|nr:EamA family transporter [Desulfovibrio sp. OttesenSCG-928-F20]
MQRYAGYLFIFLAAACWGLTGPVARFAMGDGIDPLEVAFWRAAWGAFFFLLYAAQKKALKLGNKRDLLVFIIFGVCSQGGFFASNQYAIQTGGAALAAVLLYTAPAWVAVFSRLFFHERMTIIKISAIILSLSGVVCISLSGGGIENSVGATAGSGILFGLLSGLLYSTHYIFSKNYLTRYSTYTIYGYSMLFGMLALFPFINFSSKTAFQWGILFFLGFVCTAMAYWAYCEGIKRLEATRAAVLATLEPVVATAAAWWIWQENFTLVGWAGAALVLAAVFVLIMDPQARNTSKVRDSGSHAKS